MTYPLSIPGWPAPRFARMSLDLQPISAMSQSTFTKEQQAYLWSGGIWVLKCTYPPLTKDQAAPVIAFLRALDGCYRKFYAGPPAGVAARTVWHVGDTPIVNGPHARGATSLAICNITAGTVIKQGDYLEISAGTSPVGPKRLYQNVSQADVTVGGSSSATLDIRPELREALVGSEVVTKVNPVGTFRLQDNAQAQHEWTPGPVCNILGFVAIEAIP